MAIDIVVIGAGTVGAAIAYGLVHRGLNVLMLDGSDREARAAVANFGLVWCQGKGTGFPPYQQLTRTSADLWPAFEAELAARSGIGLEYARPGGLTFCLGEDEFEARRVKLLRLHNELGGEPADWEMLERPALERLLPGVTLGPEVTGASFGRRDGHVNPLRCLSALQTVFVRAGGELRHGCRVDRLAPLAGGGFALTVDGGEIRAPSVVIAAGLGSPALAAQVGIDLPLRPQRGQILVTERVEPFLPLPTNGMRQTQDGTVMIGTTNEDVGADRSTTAQAAAAMSRRALGTIPALREATVVRQWAGLRILSPDGYPVYAQSEDHPGAFAVACHSGITLAAAHATLVADGIAAGRFPDELAPFHQRRFHVPQAA